MGQICRVCEIPIPSGFTNCDRCYYKTNQGKAEEINFLKPISRRAKLEATGKDKSSPR